MLSHAKLQSIIWTSRISQAETFYRDVLELTVKGRSDGALVFDVNGSDLRVSPVAETTPTEHTVLGFAVQDVNTVVEHLANKGIAFERFNAFPHEENGVLITPEGTKVAWFRDPDGNLLSIVQFGDAHPINAEQ